ncbi:hypothetical protein BJF77_15780 [Kocuria sp. CNJ-770]|uniref:hypothetical protein n=1 Tax=Kocuria sp. CNJ-770 TaxID=1904964 RepID=UPI0009616F09|nr:hypothetical protein [Kocuria sp. CNJ-770]OLT06213.1 hypothetical protein BJF77_15780 [Kocuria sp. CNJ-770]
MDQFSRFVILGVLGVGVFSIIVSGFFDLVEGHPFKGISMIFIGVFIGAGGFKLKRDYLRPR